MKPTTHLTEIRPVTVSLVDKGANERAIVVLKRQNPLRGILTRPDPPTRRLVSKGRNPLSGIL